MEQVLIIAGSPRKNGNTDIMASWAEDVLRENEIGYERINLRDLKFSPCIECNMCNKDGRCHVSDDMGIMYPKILFAEKIIFSSPVFFYTFGALAKAFIDRSQCFWSAKFILKIHPVEDDLFREKRKLLPLVCGGTNFPDTFDCYKKVLGNYCMMIETKYLDGVFFPAVDAKGEILIDENRRQIVKNAVTSFIK